MKKIISMLFIATIIFSSCDNKLDSEGVSTTTTYPTVEVKGSEAMTIPVGSTFTDPGFTALEGTNDISSTVKVEGTVNTAVPGVYTIKYTGTNKDGFTATARRYVGVITTAASAQDISGTYRRNAGALGYVIVSKTTYPGLYINNNPGGATTTGTSTGASIDDILIYMFNTEATVVSAPSQDSKVGEFACTGGIYDPVNHLFKWVCVNGGYGTALRTFNKI